MKFLKMKKKKSNDWPIGKQSSYVIEWDLEWACDDFWE